uniref:Rieske domain-containing protein n=1 Tax=Anguilla anguilla TaxID=7936 RepID=A0A0E9WN44_ANGAN
MASGSVDENTLNAVLWRLIGPVTELSKKQCRLVYSALGRNSDVCLFFIQGEFFAMDARCAHAGKVKSGCSI